MDWIFPAQVVRVVDGDTYDVKADLGFGIDTKQTVRLLSSHGGVNTPEKTGASKEAGIAARNRVLVLMPVGSTVYVRTEQYKQDGFRRYLAQVTLQDGRDLGDLLLAEGHATVWTR